MWESIRSALKNPLVSGPLVGGIVVLLAYADSRMRDKPREKETYWKLFAATSIIAALVVYFVIEEFAKSDEFLNQQYETDLPDMLHSAGRVASQPIMSGPGSEAAKAMESLRPGDVSMISQRLPRVRSHRPSRHSFRRRHR
jgi:hypothetical protein